MKYKQNEADCFDVALNLCCKCTVKREKSTSYILYTQYDYVNKIKMEITESSES